MVKDDVGRMTREEGFDLLGDAFAYPRGWIEEYVDQVSFCCVWSQVANKYAELVCGAVSASHDWEQNWIDARYRALQNTEAKARASRKDLKKGAASLGGL